MGKTESGNESVGYQPRAVWKQVKSVFLSAVKIPPVLDAYYAQITRGLEIESIDPAHPIGKTVESLRQGILRTLARLALAAMQSMQAAEGKREQAFTFAKKLDDLLEKHQETEQALSDVSKPPMNPKKLKEKTDLTAEAASEVAAIQKLADEIREMGWIFKGDHGKDRVVVYYWLNTLNTSGAVPTPTQLAQRLAKHATKAEFLQIISEMQEAAAEQVTLSDEILALLWLDMFWAKPPSRKTIYDMWAPDVTQAIMRACQLPIAEPTRKKPKKKKGKSSGDHAVIAATRPLDTEAHGIAAQNEKATVTAPGEASSIVSQGVGPSASVSTEARAVPRQAGEVSAATPNKVDNTPSQAEEASTDTPAEARTISLQARTMPTGGPNEAGGGAPQAEAPTATASAENISTQPPAEEPSLAASAVSIGTLFRGEEASA